MHRYQPRVHLIIRKNPQYFNMPITDIESELHRTFVFPETVFTAVTAYQNQLVCFFFFLLSKKSFNLNFFLQILDNQTKN